MKYGKVFEMHKEKTLPGMKDKFLRYKPLKKFVKRISPVASATSGQPPGGGDAVAPQLQPSPELQADFLRILSSEVERFNDFYVGKEEEFIIRLQALKEKIKQVMERGNGNSVFTSVTEFSEEILEIRKDFVAIHGEMVLLKNYSSLNFVGLIKILKKYDKRTGEFLTLPFIQFASHQPFFITAPLSSMVLECETITEVLFPAEAEVVESSAVSQDQAGDLSNLETTQWLGEETEGIYRGTLAAMTAIQGLKKASSTYNPLSTSYLFGSHDSESTGAVTAENSPCNSFMAYDSEDDEMDDVHYP